MDDVTSKIVELAREQSGLSEVTAHTELSHGVVFDSLDMFDLAMRVEEVFPVEIPDDELANFATVGDLADFVKKELEYRNA